MGNTKQTNQFIFDETQSDTRFNQRQLHWQKGPVNVNRKNDLILNMTPEKQDKTLELSKHWSADSTPARNEVRMKTTYPVKSMKCDKICSNY